MDCALGNGGGRVHRKGILRGGVGEDSELKGGVERSFPTSPVNSPRAKWILSSLNGPGMQLDGGHWPPVSECGTRTAEPNTGREILGPQTALSSQC